MSTLNPPKKISKRHELRQDQVITFYARTWDWVDKNRTTVYALLAALTVVIAAIIGWGVYQDRQAEEAQALLGFAIGVYDEGNLREALDGTDTHPGFLGIADEYGSTDVGDLAHFYAGDALLRLGELDAALEHFEAFDKEDNLIGASAYAGMAAIHEQQGNNEEAGNLYRRAALVFENASFSPQYLLDAGRAFEAAGEYDEALGVYEMIEEEFPESDLASDINFYIARAKTHQP